MTSQLENGYSCEKQQTYRIFFDKPVMLFAEHWYVVRASVSSPGGTSSDAGSSGQASVQGPDRSVINLMLVRNLVLLLVIILLIGTNWQFCILMLWFTRNETNFHISFVSFNTVKYQAHVILELQLHSRSMN